MASRKRILYSSKLVAKGAVGNLAVLKGVQSCTYGFEFTRTDVNSFGKLAPYDRLLTSTPTVNTELQVYAGANGALPARTDILTSSTTDAMDFWISLSSDTGDNDYAGSNNVNNTIRTRGNFVSSVSMEASVGGFALVNVGFEGTGMNVYDGTTNINGTNGYNLGSPAATCDARTQEHIWVNLQDTGGGQLYGTSGTVQSANLTVNIAREILEKFARRYATERLVQFPTNATLTLEALDVKNVIDFENLSQYSQNVAGQSMTRNVNFLLNLHATDSIFQGNSQGSTANYGLIGGVADSVTFNGGIGDNHTLSMVLTAPVGSTGDTAHNFRWHEGWGQTNAVL